jgi:DNA-binding transcriptional LysR family regulator
VAELLDDERRRERCRACYRMRLEEAAAYAAEHGYDGLATTLAVSPYQFTDVIREETERAAAQAGIAARVVHRTTHLPLTEKLVAAGHGVALLPRHTSLERASGRYVLLPLTDLRAGRRIEILTRPDRAARHAVRLVVEQLTAEAESASVDV